jgi:hypothetical protein
MKRIAGVRDILSITYSLLFLENLITCEKNILINRKASLTVFIFLVPIYQANGEVLN